MKPTAHITPRSSAAAAAVAATTGALALWLGAASPALAQQSGEGAASGTTASDSAPQRPTASSLLVRAEPVCASPNTKQILFDELELRLPEALRVTLQERENTAWWLDWTQQEQGVPQSCQLTLRDRSAPLLELPLLTSASPDEVRQAVVRVVWFLSTAAPSEAPRVELDAPPNPILPVIPPGGAQAVVLGPRQLPAIRPSLTSTLSSPALGFAPAEPESELAATREEERDATPEQPAVASEDTTALTRTTASAGRSSSAGGLFGRPLQVELLGQRGGVGLYGEVATNLTGLAELPAWMRAARVGISWNDRLGVGLRYKTLSTTVLTDRPWERLSNPPPDAFEGEGRLELNLFGLDAEVVALSFRTVSLMARGGMYGGRLVTQARSGQGEVRSALVMAEVETALLVELFSWAEAGVGLGYRAPLLQGNDWVLSPDELRGASALFMLRIKLF